MDYKKSNAPVSIETRDTGKIEDTTGNVYEAINIMAKRSNQIARELKEELRSKLDEFASSTDNLEEVFENREQIEISKFYEKMPKPVGISIDEFLHGNIAHEYPEKTEE